MARRRSRVRRSKADDLWRLAIGPAIVYLKVPPPLPPKS